MIPVFPVLFIEQQAADRQQQAVHGLFIPSQEGPALKGEVFQIHPAGVQASAGFLKTPRHECRGLTMSKGYD
jgi:hypothetical protein